MFVSYTISKLTLPELKTLAYLLFSQVVGNKENKFYKICSWWRSDPDPAESKDPMLDPLVAPLCGQYLSGL